MNARGTTDESPPSTSANTPPTITDNAIRVTPRRAFRGDYVRFILVNVGKKPHTFSFGAKKKGAGVQTGFTKPLRPNEQKILILFLDYRGRVTYYGSLAADRLKAGMKGIFTIS